MLRGQWAGKRAHNLACAVALFRPTRKAIYVSKGHRFTVDFSSTAMQATSLPYSRSIVCGGYSIPLSLGSLCLGQRISLHLVSRSQTAAKAVWLSKTSLHHCSAHNIKISRSTNNIFMDIQSPYRHVSSITDQGSRSGDETFNLS